MLKENKSIKVKFEFIQTFLDIKIDIQLEIYRFSSNFILFSEILKNKKNLDNSIM